jgi:hypothetical protein
MKQSTSIEDTLPAPDLSPDLRDFKVEYLRVPSVLKIRLRHELGVETVGDLVNRIDPARPQDLRFGKKPIEQVLHQVTKLATVGTEKYLKEASLQNETFPGLIRGMRENLDLRGRLLFDYRLYPAGERIITLQELGNRFQISRERVRQLEEAIIREIQCGRLCEAGWIIRDKSLALFKPPIHQLRFWQLLDHPFFAGVHRHSDTFPAPFVFLAKVFPSMFILREDTLALTLAMRRQREWMNSERWRQKCTRCLLKAEC